ncbi:response regulator [Bosea sp. Root381]|uniref:response regulator n=1 Tax=Bosea sp. Root381 TaxID=1736524 RepID=UPI0006FB463C|nr:response regulator [Bosea sp. Root381]KRE00644.1 response regulator [Bosea sp. Root381]
MARSKPLKVLIVEDEALLAMDVESMVEDSGHVVVAEATSLYEVESLDAAIDPDLAFVDMHLARGTNGLDVCALIRKRWSDAIIIFVTANPAKVPPDFAGGHGVIAKPFSRNAFMAAIHYLGEGLTSPPPSIPKPGDLVAAHSLIASWST